MTQYKTLIAILLLNSGLIGCAMNPAKKAAPEVSQYQQFYTGEMRIAHEAGFMDKTSTETSIAEADQAFRDGKMDEALFKYVKALESGGGDAAVLNKIATLHVLSGNILMAEQAYLESLKLEPENLVALEGLGMMALKLKNSEMAKSYLERVVAVDSHNWRPHNGLGLIADLQGRHMEAVEHFKNGLAIQPNQPQLHNNIGYSYYLIGDMNQAIDHFRVSLDFDPQYERAWHNIGLVYARQAEYSSALTAFRRVMDAAKAYNNVGYVCMMNGNYSEAEKFFKQAIKQADSYYPKAYENLDRVRQLRSRDG